MSETIPKASKPEDRKPGGASEVRRLSEMVRHLASEVETLRAEADIRRLQARYMALCDTPCPEEGVDDDVERVARILSLYTEDAVWEGVGAAQRERFGRNAGKAAIRAHFERFWSATRDPALVLNVHYLTCERIQVLGDEGSGQWVYCQPWVFDDGTSVLRSSRLNNIFRRVRGAWLIARTRTESVFVTPLATGWAGTVPKCSVLMHEATET